MNPSPYSNGVDGRRGGAAGNGNGSNGGAATIAPAGRDGVHDGNGDGGPARIVGGRAHHFTNFVQKRAQLTHGRFGAVIESGFCHRCQMETSEAGLETATACNRVRYGAINQSI